MADLGTSPPPQKVSRYRSQRRPQQALEQVHDPLPVQHDELPSDDNFTRSKSRYRRGLATRPATARDQDYVDVVPSPASKQATPAQPGMQTTNARPQSQRQVGGLKTYHERKFSPPTQAGATDARRVNGEELDWEEEDSRRRQLRERYSGQRNQDGELRTRQKSSGFSGELFPAPQPEAVRPAAKPVVLDGPPTSDQIRATKSTSALPKLGEEDEETAGCFGMFKRKRGEVAPRNEKRSLSHPKAGNEPSTTKPGGGGIVPGIDAPMSAVNAGDRSVLVECGKSKTIFSVTPTTTPIDIIKTAAVCMAERIDVKSAVMLESFTTVGIQRPLRRYEHIRDVMNSWDSDRQNTLILVDPGTGSSEAELSVAGAPKHKPEESSWFMSFSQKVGKWDKRHITLHPDGQITAQKDPDKPKDAISVCHLSDFDIYTPTQEKVRRKIKPPKKLCFAIKSQQKTSMFESTHDFVHFFCTNDRKTADDFHATIQGWRSWYLVHVMGEGRKPKSADNAAMEKETGVGKTHRTGKSLESAYHLGSFRPLMDMDHSDKRPATGRSIEAPPPMSAGFTKSSSQFDTTVSPERRTSRARKQNPPGAMTNKSQLAEDEPLANLGRRPSLDRRRPSLDQTKASPEEFLSSGLLGRKYSQRRQENEREEKKASAFTNGPSLLNNGYDTKEEDTGRRSLDLGLKLTHSRGQQAQRTNSGGDIQRSNSRAKAMPTPLVDLTPQYREPPQHSRKGRGYNADGSAALIENATSPEDPLGIPPSTDWRSRNTSSTSPHNRSNSLSRNAPTSKSTRRPATSGTAFTGEGLLAGSQGQAGWGTGTKGRGVLDGSHAKGPMVDLTQRNQFVNGSLLNKIEKTDIPVPVIDRSKKDD